LRNCGDDASDGVDRQVGIWDSFNTLMPLALDTIVMICSEAAEETTRGLEWHDATQAAPLVVECAQATIP
jgi:hypothetical protein